MGLLFSEIFRFDLVNVIYLKMGYALSSSATTIFPSLLFPITLKPLVSYNGQAGQATNYSQSRSFIRLRKCNHVKCTANATLNGHVLASYKKRSMYP